MVADFRKPAKCTVQFINKRPETPPYDLPADRALQARIAAVHARRCAACHQPASVSRLDWVDIRRPRQSRFLAAPLAKAAGGTGACKPGVYQDASDADYRALLDAVDAAVKRLWDRPRRDVRALKPPPELVADPRPARPRKLPR